MFMRYAWIKYRLVFRTKKKIQQSFLRKTLKTVNYFRKKHHLGYFIFSFLKFWYFETLVLFSSFYHYKYLYITGTIKHEVPKIATSNNKELLIWGAGLEKKRRDDVCLTFIRNSFKLKQNTGTRCVATFATVCWVFLVVTQMTTLLGQ